MPRKPLYTAPYQLIGGVAAIPSGSFLLPICTNRTRLIAMADALHAGGLTNNLRRVDDHNIDFLQALSNINQPHRTTCAVLPPSPIVPYTPPTPDGITVSDGCIFIDTRRYPGDVTILQETCITIEEACMGDVFDMSSYTEQTARDANAALETIAQLTEQILANTQRINSLEDQTATLAANVATALSWSTSALNDVWTLRIEADDRRQQLIGTARWYPDQSAQPPGWVGMTGQRIAPQPTVTGDYLRLVEVAPPLWFDGDDIVLPNAFDWLPYSIHSLPWGDQRMKYLTTTGTADERVNRIMGRWYIYIGDVTIS